MQPGERPGAFPRPCPSALASFGVPAKRWATRSDLLGSLEEAKRTLDQAPNGYRIAEAAKVANLAPYHFAHRFQETFGVSPAQYHRESLFARARLLLVSMSVSETATELGFESQSSFVRAFRRRFGTTPGAWRKQALDQKR